MDIFFLYWAGIDFPFLYIKKFKQRAFPDKYKEQKRDSWNVSHTCSWTIDCGWHFICILFPFHYRLRECSQKANSLTVALKVTVRIVLLSNCPGLRHYQLRFWIVSGNENNRRATVCSFYESSLGLLTVLLKKYLNCVSHLIENINMIKSGKVLNGVFRSIYLAQLYINDVSCALYFTFARERSFWVWRYMDWTTASTW